MLPKSENARPSGGTELLWLDRSGPTWVLVVDETAPFDKVRAALVKALETDKDELHGRNIYLGLGDRRLDLFDVRRLTSVLRDGFQASVVGVQCTPQSIHRHVEHTFKLKIIPEGVFEPPAMPLGFTAAPLAPVTEPEPEPIEEEDLQHEETETALEAAEDVMSVDDIVEQDDVDASDESVTDVVCSDTLDSILDEAIPTDLPEFGDIEATDIVELGAPGLESTIPSEGGRRVMVIERTLRSGSVVRFAGDVTVFGDVNSGAHIEADGNITVMGSLRGLAHAGARGDSRAVVIAFDMAAPQLRIAQRIGFCASPQVEIPAEATTLTARLQAASIGHLLRRDRPTDRTYSPEIAWIDGDSIRFDTYSGHLPN